MHRSGYEFLEPLERRLMLVAGAPDTYQPMPSPLPIQYQPYSVSFSGPLATEMDVTPNPFLDYRLTVSFLHESGLRIENVPGYFDGDGAGGSGTRWEARFTPPLPGRWKYVASFRAGAQIAVSLDPLAGQATAFDAARGTIDVAPADAKAAGFLAKGMLRHAGFYPRFDNGEYFVKAGLNSPENLLGYTGFDNTPAALHDYAAHAADWNEGDPDWNNGAGKGIIGFVNYIASHGVNSMFFMPMNIGGDAEDTWPFAGAIDPSGHIENDNLHYDLSKLDQWEIVFAHAQRKGVNLHVVLNEAEDLNKRELDDATLGIERKLFYREMIARFGHHNAVQWNISEEYDHYRLPLTPRAVSSWAWYIRQIDPYDHPIAIHNFEDPDIAFIPFLGETAFTASSFQFASSVAGRGDEVEEWRAKAQSAGRAIPISMDELRFTSTSNLDEQRRDILWPTLLSGGHAEFYFGGEPELTLNDFRPYDNLWRWCGIALDFMNTLPFWEMHPDDSIQSGEFSSGSTGGGQVYYKAGEVYAIYLPNASATGTLDLTGDVGTFQLSWLNPRSGETFAGPVIESSAAAALGPPPAEPQQDWVAVLRKVTGTLQPPAAPTGFNFDDVNDHSVTLSWNDVSDNEAGFKIMISTDGEHFSDIASAPAGATSIVIDGLEPVTTYWFRLRSYNTAGEGLSPLTVQVVTDEQIAPFYVSRLVLINADTDDDIATLYPGYVIDFAAIGTDNLNIRAEIAGAQAADVQSVRFALDSNANFRTDNGVPYALGGNSGSDYSAWTPALGLHTLTATPYTADNGAGESGAALTLGFTVRNGVPVYFKPQTPPLHPEQRNRAIDLVEGENDDVPAEAVTHHLLSPLRRRL